MIRLILRSIRKGDWGKMRIKYLSSIALFFILSIELINSLSALNIGEQSNPTRFLLNMQYKDEGKIYCSVVNHARKPIPDALIKFSIIGVFPESAYQREFKTDKEGKFEIEYSISYNSGTPLYNLKVSAEDYLEKEIKNLSLGDNYQRVLLEFKNGGKVIGKIIKKSTSEPIADAQVDLDGAMSSQTKTDANGEFRLNYLIPGDYYFYAQKDSLKQKRVTRFSISENEIRDDFILELEETYTISGKVIEQETNKPLPNITLIAQGSCKENKIVTGEDGVYVFEQVQYDLGINVISDTYLGVEPDIHFNCDKKVVLKDDLYIDNQDIYVKRGVKIKGTVSTFDSKPAIGAYLRVIKQGIALKLYSADKEGKFSFAIEPNTHFQIVVEKDGYMSAISPEYFVKDTPIEDIVLVLKKGGTIEGRVLSEKQQPISGVEVSSHTRLQFKGNIIDCNNRFSKTDEAGRFKLDNVMPGPILMRAESSELNLSKTLETNLNENEPITDFIIVLAKGLKIAGKILNENNEPVEGIPISVCNYGGSSYAETKTNRDGYYELNGLKDDYFSVFVHSENDNYESIRKDHIKSGNTDVNFILKKIMNQIISGKVFDTDTIKPIDSFKITYGTKEYEFSNSNGLFKLPEPIPIPCTITVSAKDYISENYIIKEDKQEYIITLSKGGSVKGRVISIFDNKPIEGALASILVYGNDYRKVYTDKMGEFLIDKLPYSGHPLNIKAEGYVEKTVPFIAKEGETNNLGDISLGTGCKVFGKVYDANNQPYKGVELLIPRERLSYYETVTDENGYYEFKGLPKWGYWIKGKTINGIYKYFDFREENEEKQIDFHLTGTTAKIRVLLNDDGFEGASIYGNSGENIFEGKTDDNGELLITGIKGGTYDLAVSRNDSNIWSEKITIKENQENTFTFKISDSLISGKVLNQEGNPLRSVPVCLDYTDVESLKKMRLYKFSGGVTDSKGDFGFRYVPPGDYVLSALIVVWSPSIENNHCVMKKLSLDYNEKVNNICLKFGEGRVLELTIKDSSTNKPLPYTNVAILIPPQHVQTNMDGKVWIWGIWPSNYNLRIYNPGYEILEEEITIGEEQIIQKEILLNKK